MAVHVLLESRAQGKSPREGVIRAEMASTPGCSEGQARTGVKALACPGGRVRDAHGGKRQGRGSGGDGSRAGKCGDCGKTLALSLRWEKMRHWGDLSRGCTQSVVFRGSLATGSRVGRSTNVSAERKPERCWPGSGITDCIGVADREAVDLRAPLACTSSGLALPQELTIPGEWLTMPGARPWQGRCVQPWNAGPQGRSKDWTVLSPPGCQTSESRREAQNHLKAFVQEDRLLPELERGTYARKGGACHHLPSCFW